MRTVTVIPGDGVGSEVMDVALITVEATGVDLEWDFRVAGARALREDGEAVPPETIESIRRTGVALKGPLATPVGNGHGSLNALLRKELDLYAAIRPCRTLAGRSLGRDCDLVVVRENHEDVFMGIEFGRNDPGLQSLRELVVETHQLEIDAEVGISLRPISARGTERVVRTAFEWAVATKRRLVTVGHKANVMFASDLLFLEVARRVAGEFRQISYEETLIDTLCGHLVRDPSRFDVVVLPNLFGDIVSDIGAALIGGTGVAPGMNMGPGCAVFEAVHGSAHRLVGRNVANPTGLILSAAMMLRHLGEGRAADVLELAVRDVHGRSGRVTYHQRLPSASGFGTREFGQQVAGRVAEILNDDPRAPARGGAG